MFKKIYNFYLILSRLSVTRLLINYLKHNIRIDNYSLTYLQVIPLRDLLYYFLFDISLSDHRCGLLSLFYTNSCFIIMVYKF